MAEVVQNRLVRFFVWDENFVSVGERLWCALELLGGHLGVSSPADEDLAQGDGCVEIQVGLHVLVHDFHDLGKGLDGVPPQGFAAEGANEFPLALHAVEVGARGASIPGEDQGFVTVQPLDALTHAPLLGGLAFSYVDSDPAHRVDDLLETFEIDGGVMVYGYARVVLQRVDRLMDAAVVVGGVDSILVARLHLDVEIPGYGEKLDVSSLGHHPHEHDGVGAAPHLLGVGPRVHAEYEHVERTIGDLLVPEHPLDPVARGSVDIARGGLRSMGEGLYGDRTGDELDAQDQCDQHDG